MKITPVFETARSVNSVREKQDGQNRGQQHPEQQKKKDEGGFQKFDPKKVEQAVATFETDSQTKANNLHAFIEGTGPGLKVVLKDGRGAIVRQFTGEEFVEMREAVAAGRARGKILDQKL